MFAVLVLRVFFFFQAEDGIRDVAVTGVQTCALSDLRICDTCPSRRAAHWGRSRSSRAGRCDIADDADLRRSGSADPGFAERAKPTCRRRLRGMCADSCEYFYQYLLPSAFTSSECP